MRLGISKDNFSVGSSAGRAAYPSNSLFFLVRILGKIKLSLASGYQLKIASG